MRALAARCRVAQIINAIASIALFADNSNKKVKKAQNNKKEQFKKEKREQKDVNLKCTQSQVGLQEEPSGSTQNKKEVNQEKKESDKSLGPQSSPLLVLLPAVASSHKVWADFSDQPFGLLEFDSNHQGPFYMGRERAPWVEIRSEPLSVQPWHVGAVDAVHFGLLAVQFTLWHAFALTWKCLGIDVGNWWIFGDVLVSWLDGFWCDVFVGHVYPLTPCLLTLLFTATFVAARRVRYSSPWLRALFLGCNLHLDVVWVTRLAVL